MKSKYNVLLYEVRWDSFLRYTGDLHSDKTNTSLFCIVLPPPNITGTLHLGHAFQCTLMDFLMRYSKTIGKRVFWQGGLDHAGIATQVLVERNLLSLGFTRRNYARFNFIKFSWFWKLFSHDIIISQMKCLAVFINWSTFCFTLDINFTNSVKTAFIALYEKGIVYEGKKLVNWDVALKTAVSDLEVNFVEEVKTLWFIYYKSVSTHFRLLVATTRPETILVDSAVAVNPDDVRYNRIVGTYLRIPISNALIPLIDDSSVSLFFGSGCVKVTPAHDFNDYKIACVHNLRFKLLYNVQNFAVELKDFTKYNGINYNNLLRTSSYNLALRKCTCFTKEYVTLSAVGERTGAKIEPVLLKQWFVLVQELCRNSITSVGKNEILFFPETYKKTYLQWLSNLEDWCISRQIWWGHRVPVWRDADTKKIYTGFSENNVREKFNLCSAVKLIRDVDVLDTWFSSALWPFAALGWPNLKQNYLNFYPLSVLITGYDILFFWVARMVMFGLALTGVVPFKAVFVHGLVKDMYGVKMSKSKGNTVDPIDIVNGASLEILLLKSTFGLSDEVLKKRVVSTLTRKFPNGVYSYGVDALRATLCTAAVPGRSIFFSTRNVEIFRNFCTKLWNVGRFLRTQLKSGLLYYQNVGKTVSVISGNEICMFDFWFINKWLITKYLVSENIKVFRFDAVVKYLSNFVVDTMSSIFLEVCKYKQSVFGNKCSVTNIIFSVVFFDFLIVAHSVLPCLTTELWCNFYRLRTKRSFAHIVESYNVYKYSVSKCIETRVSTDTVRFLLNFIKAVRTYTSKYNTIKEESLRLNVHLRCDFSYVLLKYRGAVEAFSGVLLQFKKKIESSELLFFLSGVGCYVEKKTIITQSANGDIGVVCFNVVFVAQNLTDLFFIHSVTQEELTCEKIKFIGLIII